MADQAEKDIEVPEAGMPMLARTTAAWGITGDELKRLSAAVHFMNSHCQRRSSSLWWVTKDRRRNRIGDRLSTRTRSMLEFQRKSRQHLCCTDHCRDWNKGQKRVRKSFLDGDTRASPNPLFLSKQISGLQGRTSGSNISLNVLCGYRWPNAVDVERDLLRKIIRAEVGGL